TSSTIVPPRGDPRSYVRGRVPTFAPRRARSTLRAHEVAPPEGRRRGRRRACCHGIPSPGRSPGGNGEARDGRACQAGRVGPRLPREPYGPGAEDEPLFY